MELHDSIQVSNLLARFATLADIGSLEEIGTLLSVDIVWQMGGTMLKGRDDVIAALGQIRRAEQAGPGTGTRHVVSNFQIELDGEDHARAHSYFLFITVGDAPAVSLFGEYRDTLCKENGRWVIASRLVII